MRQAILIHGCCNKNEFEDDAAPSGSNAHWFPWLQKQLVKRGIETQTPEMPAPYAPRYTDWSRVFSSFSVNEETTIVAHSCGAGFILRWLGDHNQIIDKLILVAPWLDPIKNRKGFLDFEINPAIRAQVKRIDILVSSDEPVEGVAESVELISNVLPETVVHRYENMGHFTSSSMDSLEFQDLLKLILD